VCVNPVGIGLVTLNEGSAIDLERVTAVNPLIVNGGTFLTANGWGATWSGPVTLNGSLNCNNDYNLVFSGAVSGTGGIIKTRGGLLLLSGGSSYSGNTTVNAGTFQMNSANSGNDGSSLTIAASGATVNLNFAGTDVVNKLYVGSTQMAAGIYKAVGSSAAGMELAKLTGTGTITVAPGATSTTVVSSFNPAGVGASVTFTATVLGTIPSGNVTFYAGTTVLGISALNASFQASFTTSSMAMGTYSITASYAGNLTNSASSSISLSQVITQPSYRSWASDPAQLLTAGMNNGAMDDPDRDGISNLMEFTLGGVPMTPRQSILPTLTKQASGWMFVYDRSDASLASALVQVVQYGNDLTGWTTIPIPMTTSSPVTITPGSPSDSVSVVIPSVGPRTFVRLKVTQ
jgi:autotransporter-associated beta strand protein